MKQYNSTTDGHGNTLHWVSNGRTVVVTLELFKEKRKRRVGVINIAQRILTVVRKREDHTLHKYSGYGFNYKLIKDAKVFDTVLLIDDNGKYKLPREEIINSGEVLAFGKAGFELQIFYKHYKLDEYKQHETGKGKKGA